VKRGAGKRAFEILRKASKPLYWCDRCNVPLLTRVCGVCGGEGRPVKLTPPADARPALGLEHVQLWKLIESELDAGCPYPRRRIVLLNKVPYVDSADEVIVDGYVIGHRYYDLVRGSWRFKPVYYGVSAILKSKVGYYAVADVEILKRGFELHAEDLLEANLPRRGSEKFVAIGTTSGYEGVGVYTKRKRVRVLKSWKAKSFEWNAANPSWLDAVRANEARLAILEQEAVDFLKNVAGKYKLPPVVSFSGGKDSLVAFWLSQKAFGEVTLLFNDTGLELPETVDYVKRVAQSSGSELIVASAGDAFWRGLEAMGPPARDYRWCCKVAKLVPTAKAVRERFAGGALSIVGQRRAESASRARSPRVYRNKWLPDVVVAAPIHSWSALEVWLYIFKERLPVNPLYFKGFDRLGCWLCPAIEMGEAEAVRERHPELWARWESYLRAFSEKAGLGEAWVKLGLWRWLAAPGDIKRVAQRFSGQEASIVSRGPRFSVETEDGEVRVELKGFGGALSPEDLAEALSSLGTVEVSEGGLKLSGAPVKVEGAGGVLRVSVRNAERADGIARAVIRAAYCVGCGSCELWCPKGAVKVTGGRFRVDLAACAHCGMCNAVCPVAEYAVRAQVLEEALSSHRAKRVQAA
jgi:phosphoadenosine phosphosulfate reductase